jgi:hypothetical protein
MRRAGLVFFTGLLVLASCFIAGCNSLPVSGSPPQKTPGKIDVGFTGQEIPGTIQRYQFEDTLADLISKDLNATGDDIPINVSREKHIKSIRGTDLDEKGAARSWTFIVEHGSQISIVTYNQQGMISSSAPGTIKRAEIFTSQILSPRELFNKNRAVIFNTTMAGTTGSLDLSLSEGYYSLTLSGNGTPENLVFDAKTGALTS